MMPARSSVCFENATPPAAAIARRGYTVLPTSIPRAIARVSALMPFAWSQGALPISRASSASSPTSPMPGSARTPAAGSLLPEGREATGAVFMAAPASRSKSIRSHSAADRLVCETDLFSIINLSDLLIGDSLRMHITLRQLEIFRAIALTGSTTAAAQSVPLSQSATSTALGEFERSLGARLFDRVGKRLLLNDNGRALLPLALGVLDGAQHIERAFAAGGVNLAADLRLHASTTVGNYILPRLLSGFRELVPAARFDVRIGNTLDVVTAVREF